MKKLFEKKGLLKAIIIVTTVLNIAMIACFFVAYGPVKSFRNWFVTTALSTGEHKYFANILYSDEMITKVMAENTIVENTELLDQGAISIGNTEIPETFTSPYEKQVLEREEGAKFKTVEVTENGYHAYMTFVYNPLDVQLGTPQKLGKKGEKLTAMAQRYGCSFAINAGGWGYDGTNQYPSGYLYRDGKILYAKNRPAKWGGGSVGFTKEGVLLLTKSTGQAALDEGMWVGTDFGPFLIVNGKTTEFKGNGGFGSDPRTCIGQRKDGIVVFLVVDGRSSTSSGATIKDCAEIMERYGCYNACNMDGGGSTVMAINGKLANTPKGYGYTGERNLQSFWYVM